MISKSTVLYEYVCLRGICPIFYSHCLLGLVLGMSSVTGWLCFRKECVKDGISLEMFKDSMNDNTQVRNLICGKVLNNEFCFFNGQKAIKTLLFPLLR